MRLLRPAALRRLASAATFDAHLEAAILAHLAERLRSSEVVEAVAKALVAIDEQAVESGWEFDHDEAATAALAAVAEALGVEA